MASKSVLAVLTSSILAVSHIGFSATEALAADCFTVVNNEITNDERVSESRCSGDLVIPNTITAIADDAFSDNELITSLSFEAGSSLINIGANAFKNTTGLTGGVAIPSSVTEVKSAAFSGSTLEALTFETGSALTTIGPSAFINTTNLIGAIDIPASVTFIDNAAFQSSSITTLSVAAGSALTAIGSSAFQGVSTLTSVDLSQATLLNSVGNSAFTNATSLTSFDFGDSPNLTTLPGGFLYASGLSEVTIPASITTIGGGVFAGSVSLATVNFLGDAPGSIQASAFGGIAQNPVAIVSPTATGFDADFETTTGLTVQRQSSTPAAPVPYSGPLVTNIGSAVGAVNVFANETVTVSGERLSTVSKVFVDGLEGEVISTSADSFVMTVPEGLDPGRYDLEIQSSLGNLTYLDAFVVTEESIAAASYGEVSAWTKRISDTQAKVYVKYPTVGERVRIGHQTGGSGDYDTVYVKTTVSEDDGAMIVNEHGSYIVRTIDLASINRIRVTVGDEVMVQVRYNQ